MHITLEDYDCVWNVNKKGRASLFDTTGHICRVCISWIDLEDSDWARTLEHVVGTNVLSLQYTLNIIELEVSEWAINANTEAIDTSNCQGRCLHVSPNPVCKGVCLLSYNILWIFQRWIWLFLNNAAKNAYGGVKHAFSSHFKWFFPKKSEKRNSLRSYQ